MPKAKRKREEEEGASPTDLARLGSQIETSNILECLMVRSSNSVSTRLSAES
jgi:hypothetical protein